LGLEYHKLSDQQFPAGSDMLSTRSQAFLPHGGGLAAGGIEYCKIYIIVNLSLCSAKTLCENMLKENNRTQ
jgi:hypothetical protein